VARLRSLVDRLIALADEPSDDDDFRLRKRIGVVAGYLSIVAPLSVIGTAQQQRIAIPLGLSLSALSAINLVVLAKSGRFDRYVIVLIAAGALFTTIAIVIIGGVLVSSAAMFWAFLVPVYATLALGPRRATAWFGVFLAVLVLVVLIDPVVRSAISPPPYQQQLFSYLFNVGAPAAIVFFLFRYTDLRRRQAQDRSDELLANALPASIAARMKHGEQRIAESYPETTILFADLVGFTPWAQRTDPDRVVSVLDDLFSRFDELAAECGVEKIKTIGDAYMAVAGAPEARPDHAFAALTLAQRMLSALAEARAPLGLPLQMRVGLASGSVVAGVIGQQRILFDLWGDTVNIASRMESAGVPGRIQVSASTHALLGDDISFEEREAIDVKGLGHMTTYLVGDRAP
jgi:adenylate cyclase